MAYHSFQVWGWSVGSGHPHIIFNHLPQFACFRQVNCFNIPNKANTVD